MFTLDAFSFCNRKVFKKHLGFELADDVLNKVVNAEPFAIEQVRNINTTKDLVKEPKKKIASLREIISVVMVQLKTCVF